MLLHLILYTFAEKSQAGYSSVLLFPPNCLSSKKKKKATNISPHLISVTQWTVDLESVVEQVGGCLLPPSPCHQHLSQSCEVNRSRERSPKVALLPSEAQNTDSGFRQA